jgi:MoaA/NifB/PqqE/SkfB family radical SAM enzyme
LKELRNFIYKFGEFIEKTVPSRDISCIAPEELHFELTYNCNTDCVMCNLKYLKDKEKKELTLDEIKSFVKQSEYLKKIKFIVISGGEPLLRYDIVDIVKFLRQYYPDTEILILSNLYDENLVFNKLNLIKKDIGLYKISIGTSIDAVGKEHDIIRGQTDSFNNLSKNLERLKKEFPEVYFSLNYTLMPANCDKMVEVYDWCSQRGYHVSFQMFVQKEETQQFVWEENVLEKIQEQIDTITKKIAKECNIEEFDENIFLKNEGLTSRFLSLYYIVKYIKNKKRFFPNCPCGEKYAMINPYGEVYFCPVYKNMFAGDLKKDSFDVLWDSKQAKSVRDFFNLKKCHCWLTCTNGYMLQDGISHGKQLYIAQKYKNK